MVGRGIVHQLISAGPDELVRNSPWKVSGAYSRLAQEGSWLALIASSFALSSHGARGRDFKSFYRITRLTRCPYGPRYVNSLFLKNKLM